MPFYFTPYSPMLYNIRTGWGGVQKRPNEEIVILVSSLRDLHLSGKKFIFTDRHAYLQTAQFFTDLSKIGAVDWEILQQRDFKRNPDDPGKFERYQAEALIYRHLPIEQLRGIVCCNDSVAKDLTGMKYGLDLKIISKPNWYFQ